MADISQIVLSDTSDAKNIKALKLSYGECDTAAATTAKVVTIISDGAESGNNAPFVLEKGAVVLVKFTVTNTGAVANLTLNVNGTGAKNIKYRNANLSSAGILAANRVYQFVYDGTYWQLVGDLDTDTDTNSQVSQQETSTNGEYKVLFSYNTASTNVTNIVRKDDGLKFNPSSDKLTVSGKEVIGTGTASSSSGSLVIGRYNTTDTDSTYVFMIGKGLTSTSPEDAFTVDWSGNVVTSGNITTNDITADKVQAPNTTNVSGATLSLSGIQAILKGYTANGATSSTLNLNGGNATLEAYGTVSVNAGHGALTLKGQRSSWTTGGGTAAHINSSGQIVVYSSSLRYKDNIDYDIDREEYHNELMQLKPCTYEYKEIPGEENLGLVAEDVYDVNAQLVNYDDDFEIESFRDRDIMTMLIIEAQEKDKVIQELQQEIAELRQLILQ